MPIGTFGKQIGERNRERVFEYFQNNPCSTNQEAAQALDLSVMAVGRHAKSIREGWRPKGDGESA